MEAPDEKVIEDTPVIRISKEMFDQHHSSDPADTLHPAFTLQNKGTQIVLPCLLARISFQLPSSFTPLLPYCQGMSQLRLHSD